MVEETNKKKKVIDDRWLYLIPSIIGICLALTALLFFFGYKIIDVNNTCYHLFISPPVENGAEMSDQEVLARLDEILKQEKISGFTIMKNLQGGVLTEQGEMELSNSYQIILMSISKNKMENIAHVLAQQFSQDMILIDETVTKSYYMTPKGEKVESLFDYFDSVTGE